MSTYTNVPVYKQVKKGGKDSTPKSKSSKTFVRGPLCVNVRGPLTGESHGWTSVCVYRRAALLNREIRLISSRRVEIK